MIIVAGGDPGRLHAALSVAAAWAALDRAAHVFLQADAVGLLRSGPAGDDQRHRQSGTPTLRELLEESLALGVSVTACQSGLALSGLGAGDLPVGVETGGLLDSLSRHGNDQLMMT